jgi:hypothetical protein
MSIEAVVLMAIAPTGAAIRSGRYT